MKRVLIVISCIVICISFLNFAYASNSQNEILDIESDAYEVAKWTTEFINESTEEEKAIEEEKEEEFKNQITENNVEKIQPTSKPKKSYTSEDVYVLSHVIFGEAGGYSRELQIGVGSVVLNRVKDERYPNTIKDVVFQDGQYACAWDGNYDREPDQQAIDVAIYLLENGSQYPEYIIYQSEFLQGDSIYKQIGNTYFCYWKKDVK